MNVEFIKIAAPLAAMGIPITPVRPGTKRAFLPDFPTTATTDLAQIEEWAKLYPDHNAASVARAEEGGCWFWETDSADVATRLKNDTGHDITELNFTFRVRSRPGRGHYYFRHNAASMSLGNISQTYVKCQDWSVRTNREYVVAPGSRHPETGQLYTALNNNPIMEAPLWLIDWLLSQRVQKISEKTEVLRNDRGLVPHGAIHGYLLTQAGRLRHLGLSEEPIRIALRELVEKNCQPPIDWDKVDAMARSICNFKEGENTDIALTQGMTADVQVQTGANTITDPSVLEDDEVVVAPEIPAFDSAVMTGIMRDYVELATVGTTLVPQFAFMATRVIIGALMTGKGIKFKDADTDAMLYGSVIGESGSGKGWAWRRVLQAFEVGAKGVGTLDGFGCKIMDGIDSGAGLKDHFFTPPVNQPIIVYVDEVADMGEKADPKRNPGIVTAIIELAENRSVSRTLAGKKRHTDKAFLGIYIAGQNGEVYMQSLPNRTRLGLFDRFRPEYSIPVVAENTPDVDADKAAELFRRLQSLLSTITTMTLDSDAQDSISLFWASQPEEIKTKVRYKKHVLVDAFMSAFSRGSSIVEDQDVYRAINIFNRELVIRKIHFSKEVPNRMAVFTEKMIELTEKMRRQLNRGAHQSIVALGRSDFEKACGAYKSGEYDLFDRAWQTFSRAHLNKANIVKGNGQVYEKYLPKPNDNGGARGW